MTDEIQAEVEALEQHIEQTSDEPNEVQDTQTSEDVTDDVTEEKPEEQKQTRSQNSKHRLKRKLGEAEQRNAQLAEQLEKQQQTLSALESKVESVINPPPPRPDRVNFETEEDYEDALWEFRQPKVEQPASEPVPAQPEPQRRFVSDDVQENWLDQVEMAKENHSDFTEKLNAIPSENMTEAMTFSIMESDHAGEVAYFLGDNLAEAARISKLGLTAQVREIDKLSNKFKSSTSSAPAPIEPVKGADVPTKDIENMSMAEYAAYMNKKQYG